MRISTKGRYSLSAMIYLGCCEENQKLIPLFKISEDLGISKIFLEQAFSLLKKAGLVTAVKGSSGGYRLSRNSHDISVYDVLQAIEVPLFEKTEPTLNEQSATIEKSMDEYVWHPLDEQIQKMLKSITLYTLSEQTIQNRNNQGFMYYI